MAILDMVFNHSGQTFIGNLRMDALLSETATLQNHVTSYAVEDGAEISDNITVRPEELSLSGTITAASTVLFGSGGKSKLIHAKAALRQLHQERQPITIMTGIDSYVGYAITALTIQRTNEGEKLDVDAEFRKINLAGIQTAEIPQNKVSDATPDQAQTKERAGKTAAKAGSVSQSSSQSVEPTKEVIESKPDSWLLSAGKGVGVFK